MGHVGSKTRPLGQFLEKPYVLSRRHSFDPVFMKLCQNDFLTLNQCLSRRAMLSDDSSCYIPAYSKNSGRALSVTPVSPLRPSVRLSVHPYVPLSCPGHNSKTLWNIFMKLHRCIHHNKTMCHEQGRQLLHFWFLNYFPLT